MEDGRDETLQNLAAAILALSHIKKMFKEVQANVETTVHLHKQVVYDLTTFPYHSNVMLQRIPLITNSDPNRLPHTLYSCIDQ